LAHAQQTVSNCNHQLAESEHNYQLLLAANAEYERLLTEQAENYNHVKEECLQLQARLHQADENEERIEQYAQ
jgi:hypothetical protein